jgi:hypothetical protein
MSLCEQASTRDFNRDGKSEELHVSVRMPLACDEIITGASLIAFLDVSLAVRTVFCVSVRACFFVCVQRNKRVRLHCVQSATRAHMDALVRIEGQTASSAASLLVDGDLGFRQRCVWPLILRRSASYCTWCFSLPTHNAVMPSHTQSVAYSYRIRAHHLWTLRL